MTAGTTRMNEIAVSDNFFLFLLFISTLQYQSGLYVACLFAVWLLPGLGFTIDYVYLYVHVLCILTAVLHWLNMYHPLSLVITIDG